MDSTHKITNKQLIALNNKRASFGLNWGKNGEPKTKKDAIFQFKRLDNLIAQIKLGLDDGFEDGIDNNDFVDNDYLDPIY